MENFPGETEWADRAFAQMLEGGGRAEAVAVESFYERFGAAVKVPLRNDVNFVNVMLSGMADQLDDIAKRLEDQTRDDPEPRVSRCHFLAEELGELFHALAAGDEVATLDALADLKYVVVGTAVKFDLPLAEAFVEVHRSNMTKERREDRPGHFGKGPGYSPPDLAKILSNHRSTGVKS